MIRNHAPSNPGPGRCSKPGIPGYASAPCRHGPQCRAAVKTPPPSWLPARIWSSGRSGGRLEGCLAGRYRRMATPSRPDLRRGPGRGFLNRTWLEERLRTGQPPPGHHAVQVADLKTTTSRPAASGPGRPVRILLAVESRVNRQELIRQASSWGPTPSWFRVTSPTATANARIPAGRGVPRVIAARFRLRPIGCGRDPHPAIARSGLPR
jgi:hypothetical protein